MKRKYIELIWLRGIGSLKADAQNSYLGSLWWVLEPLLMTGLFYLAFASGIRGSRGAEFAIFLFCGLLPFKWTASCMTIGANSILSNKGIMGQTYLPKWIFPATINLSMAIRFCFVLPILLLLVTYVGGEEPTRQWITLGYVIICQLIFNLGVSYIFASTVPILPDLNYLVPLVTTGMMFTSGIFFDISDRPENIQTILRLNPFVEILDSYRAVLLRGEPISPLDMTYSGIFGISTLVIGYCLIRLFDRYYPRALP